MIFPAERLICIATSRNCDWVIRKGCPFFVLMRLLWVFQQELLLQCQRVVHHRPKGEIPDDPRRLRNRTSEPDEVDVEFLQYLNAEGRLSQSLPAFFHKAQSGFPLGTRVQVVGVNDTVVLSICFQHRLTVIIAREMERAAS